MKYTYTLNHFSYQIEIKHKLTTLYMYMRYYLCLRYFDVITIGRGLYVLILLEVDIFVVLRYTFQTRLFCNFEPFFEWMNLLSTAKIWKIKKFWKYVYQNTHAHIYHIVLVVFLLLNNLYCSSFWRTW